MKIVYGLKLLTAEGQSINGKHGRVTYTGDWQDVPGNGAYVAVTGGAAAGGHGPTLAVMECDEASEVDAPRPDGVRCFRRVRWVKDWTPQTDAQREADAAWDKACAAWAKACAAWDKAYAAWAKASAARVKANAAWAKASAARVKACAAWDKAYDAPLAALLASLNTQVRRGT